MDSVEEIEVPAEILATLVEECVSTFYVWFEDEAVANERVVAG